MKSKSPIFILLLFWLIVSYNSQFAATSIPFIGFGINVLLGAALLLFSLKHFFKSKINEYQRWVLVNLVYWGASVSWSVSPDAFHAFFSISIQYLICFFISSSLASKKDIERVLKLELVAVLLCAIYVLIFVHTGNLTEERLGGNEEDRIWNANDIGLKMAVGFAIGTYFILKKSAMKLPLVLSMLLFIVVGLMSGSRKVIVLLLSFITLLIIIRAEKRRRLLYIAYSILFVCLSLYLVFEIPLLYDILGFRIEMMMDALHGDSGGYSMDERALMIGYGIEFIADSPWIGRGFDGFSYLFGNITGWYTYSHNNYIELLANTGVIGLILYYSLIIYILKNLWKPAFREKDLLAQILFLYTLITTILDCAMVSFPNIPTIFRLMYTTMYCKILKSQFKEPTIHI